MTMIVHYTQLRYTAVHLPSDSDRTSPRDSIYTLRVQRTASDKTCDALPHFSLRRCWRAMAATVAVKPPETVT